MKIKQTAVRYSSALQAEDFTARKENPSGNFIRVT